jgi:hypothetical protein
MYTLRTKIQIRGSTRLRFVDLHALVWHLKITRVTDKTKKSKTLGKTGHQFGIPADL